MNLGQFNLHKGKTKKAAIFSMIYFKIEYWNCLGGYVFGTFGLHSFEMESWRNIVGEGLLLITITCHFPGKQKENLDFQCNGILIFSMTEWVCHQLPEISLYQESTLFLGPYLYSHAGFGRDTDSISINSIYLF